MSKRKQKISNREHDLERPQMTSKTSIDLKSILSLNGLT